MYLYSLQSKKIGVILNEALVLEKTAIVSNSVISQYDLISLRNGLVFENNDYKELSNCILYLLNNKKIRNYEKEFSSNFINLFIQK